VAGHSPHRWDLVHLLPFFPFFPFFFFPLFFSYPLPLCSSQHHRSKKREGGEKIDKFLARPPRPFPSLFPPFSSFPPRRTKAAESIEWLLRKHGVSTASPPFFLFLFPSFPFWGKTPPARIQSGCLFPTSLAPPSTPCPHRNVEGINGRLDRGSKTDRPSSLQLPTPSPSSFPFFFPLLPPLLLYYPRIG